MVFSGPWFLGEIAKGVDYGLAPLPTISRGRQQADAAVDHRRGRRTSPRRRRTRTPPTSFVKYLTDVPAAKVLALEGRQTPANKAVYADPQVAADPVLKAFRQQVDVAVPMPNLPEMSMVWSPATTAMNAIVKKAATPEGGAGPGAEGSAWSASPAC